MPRLRLTLASLLAAGLFTALPGCSSAGGSSSGSASTAPSAKAVVTTPAVALTGSAALTPLAPARTRTDEHGNQVSFAPVTLRRNGNLVVLEVAARNVTPAGQGSDSAILGVMLETNNVLPDTGFDSVSLVDQRHAKRYLVVYDSNKACLCSKLLGMNVPRGGSAVPMAYFAAPPSDVTSVDVVIDKVGAFPAVPLS